MAGATEEDPAARRVYTGEIGPWRSLASALAWGARGPGFKSRRPDQITQTLTDIYLPPAPLRSPFGGVLESNFWTPSSLFRLPLHAVRVVLMAMSYVFCDSAPQEEENRPSLYMRITDGWSPAWLGRRAWS